MTIDEWKQDFKSYINELQMQRDDYMGIMAYIDEGAELLKEHPEIVRCKDCKYYRYYGPDSYISSECTLEMTDGPIPTWFCAGGVRR